MGLPKDYDYSPLPNSLYMWESTIQGMGIFAAQSLEKGYTEIDVPTHIELDNVGLIRTSLGGWINHSDTPNATLRVIGALYPMYYLVMLRDVMSDEEITLDYNNEMCGCGEDKMK